MRETARGRGLESPGFYAKPDPGNQAATTHVRHGIDSKLLGRALRKETHGACASPNYTTRVLDPNVFGQGSTRQASTYWPRVRDELPRVSRVPALARLGRGAACLDCGRFSAHPGHRASSPIQIAPGIAEACLRAARTFLSLPCTLAPLRAR